ncbi:hypothetical protein Tco_1032964, partial [Tanacetum coccineum]
IWVVKPEGIHCIQAHDVKEAVHGLTADANCILFLPKCRRHSTPPSYSSGPSTPPNYSSGPSTPTNYSLGSSRNGECSNCKHLRGKISVLKTTMEMHMHPEQHTVNSAALFHEVLNEMEKLDLE